MISNFLYVRAIINPVFAGFHIDTCRYTNKFHEPWIEVYKHYVCTLHRFRPTIRNSNSTFPKSTYGASECHFHETPVVAFGKSHSKVNPQPRRFETPFWPHTKNGFSKIQISPKLVIPNTNFLQYTITKFLLKCTNKLLNTTFVTCHVLNLLVIFCDFVCNYTPK